METILIIMHKYRIEWVVRDQTSTIASGSDPLSSTNGYYDSLLSNVVNHCHSLCKTKDVDFIFRRS